MQSKENDQVNGKPNGGMENRIKDLLARLKVSQAEQPAPKLEVCLGSNLQNVREVDQLLIDEIRQKEASPEYQEMKRARSSLPSYKMRYQIVDAIKRNQVILISGETGCGKTTQIGQFILDDAIENGKGSVTKIVCTQPRRISAIAVAERVAAERCEELGKSIGYQIRLEKVMCRDYGSILFCTGGILLQNMRGDIGLGEYSHIILDEIHERTTDSDLIITLLKQIIHNKPNLKVILMSATLDAEKFSKYFNNCPTIHIPGLTYPVKEYYLEDVIAMTKFKFSESQIAESNRHVNKNIKKIEENLRAMKEFERFICPVILRMCSENAYPQFVLDELKLFASEKLSLSLIVEVIKYICKYKGPGAILIFVPGMQDISQLMHQIDKSEFYNECNFQMYPVHSRLSTTDQQAIFDTPPRGVRKIIIATSIAETSITINDVEFVIDTGKIKLSRYDLMRKIECLEIEWITRANGIQRKGRAGRVQNGECYKLYSRAREQTFQEYPTPEIMRASLDQILLQLKMMQLGPIEEFFKKLMGSPSPKSVQITLNLMKRLKAVDDKENLTPLGFHLARLPTDPRIAKMIILSAIFSCVDPIFSIAASLSFKDAFYQTVHKRDAAKDSKSKLAGNQSSDHIAFAEASRTFESFKDEDDAKEFCSNHYLNFTTLKQIYEMKQEFAHTLYDMKFIVSNVFNDPRLNKNSKNMAIVKAIICAGLYPNIAKATNICGRFLQFRTLENEDVRIHPNSVNFNCTISAAYSTYFCKQKSTHIYLHDTTIINPMAIIFAAPNQFYPISDIYATVKIDELFTFNCKLSAVSTFKELHTEMNKLFEKKLSDPQSTIDWDLKNELLLRKTINILNFPDLYF